MASTVAVSTRVGAAFVDALTHRDYAALAACFAEGATLRSVVPPGIREDDGPEAIAERFRIWTGEIVDYEIVDSEASRFHANVLRLRWTVRGYDPSVDGGPSTFEQTAYADVTDDRIVRMRLACSGDLPLA